MYQVVWDFLLDYGRLEWQWTLHDMEKAPDVAYEDVLRNLIQCVEELSFESDGNAAAVAKKRRMTSSKEKTSDNEGIRKKSSCKTSLT